MYTKKIAKKFLKAQEKKRNPNHKPTNNKLKRAHRTMVLIIIIGCCMAITCNMILNFNDHEYVATVVRVERVNTNDDSRYLIFCEKEDGETIVFENTDNWLRGKLNSSDIYAMIQSGETYRFRVIGFRVPLFNWYENIIEVTNVENL